MDGWMKGAWKEWEKWMEYEWYNLKDFKFENFCSKKWKEEEDDCETGKVQSFSQKKKKVFL